MKTTLFNEVSKQDKTGSKMRKNSRRRRKIIQKKWMKRKKSKNLTQNETMLPMCHILPNPYYGKNINQLWSKLQKTAETNEETYQNTLSELMAELEGKNPLHVFTHVANYGLHYDLTKFFKKLDSNDVTIPFHIETLQALLLQISPEKISRKLFSPDKIGQVRDPLKKLCINQIYRHFNPSIQHLTEEEKTIEVVRFIMSVNKIYFRNWCHHSQVKRLARELYSHFDEKLFEARKFSVSDIINVFEALYFGFHSKLTDHIEEISNLFKLSDNDAYKIVKKYYGLADFKEEKDEQFNNESNKQNLSRIEAITYIVGYHYLQLPKLYTFQVAEIAKSLNICDERVKAVLDEYALPLGALSGYKSEDLHISNPVWVKPIVKLPANDYFYAVPDGFFRFAIPCIEGVLTSFKSEVDDRRAKFLVSKVAEIVKNRFPSSQIMTNFKWVKDEKKYETDLVVFIDTFVLLIECKSEKIAEPSLRGEPNRLQRFIKKLLIDPNEQSLRLKMHLEFLSSNADVVDPIRDQISYDLGNVNRVIRLSVSLDNFGQIQSNLMHLKTTGLLPSNFVPCPSMNLASFETVFDILEDPIHIIDYLMKRESIEESTNYIADEIDLLGLFLKTLFNIEAIKPDKIIEIKGLSAPLYDYYNSLDRGVTLEKPRPEISPLFSSIISQLENSNEAQLNEIKIVLNLFSPDFQIEMTKKLDVHKKQLNKYWNTAREPSSMVLFRPSELFTCALVYVMFKDDLAIDSRYLMEEARTKALKNATIQTVVVIGKNLDRDSTTYEFIKMFRA